MARRSVMLPRRARRFKSREAYRKWLAYGHIRTKTGKIADHGKSVFEAAPGHQKVVIRGKERKIGHE